MIAAPNWWNSWKTGSHGVNIIDIQIPGDTFQTLCPLVHIPNVLLERFMYCTWFYLQAKIRQNYINTWGCEMMWNVLTHPWFYYGVNLFQLQRPHIRDISNMVILRAWRRRKSRGRHKGIPGALVNADHPISTQHMEVSWNVDTPSWTVCFMEQPNIKWRFPKMGIPPNHQFFLWDFPL